MAKTPQEIYDGAVTQFKINKAGQARIWLDNGTLHADADYRFFNAAGQQVSTEETTLTATAQQLADLKVLLVALKSATDADFVALGWRR